MNDKLSVKIAYLKDLNVFNGIIDARIQDELK
jgi:hypothetical protein